MRFAKLLTASTVVAALVCVPLAAAQTNTVLEHYRAYTAALERRDFQTAASEAQAALSASIARNGDGGRTGVLYLNLATVRRRNGEIADALAAARRAMELARGGAAGVNPAYAELVVVGLELQIAGQSAEADMLAQRMMGLLSAADAAAVADSEMYFSATQLGVWALTRQNYDVARAAWAIAGAHPGGAELGEQFGRGFARTNEGVSIISQELARGRSRFDVSRAHEAHRVLSEAFHDLQPLSRRESPGHELTAPQLAYAQTLAWLSALEEKLRADESPIPAAPPMTVADAIAALSAEAGGPQEIGAGSTSLRRCPMRIAARPEPSYPRVHAVGAVVVFFKIGVDGQVLVRDVIARAGSAEFAEAVERVLPRWRVERIQPSPEDCTLEANLILLVRFRAPPRLRNT